MAVASHIFTRAVVDNAMLVSGSRKAKIGAEIVCVDSRTSHDVLTDKRLLGAPLHVRNDLS